MSSFSLISSHALGARRIGVLRAGACFICLVMQWSRSRFRCTERPWSTMFMIRVILFVHSPSCVFASSSSECLCLRAYHDRRYVREY